MRDLRSALAGSAVVLLCAVGATSGDEPARLEPPPVHRWQAGDAVARTEMIDYLATSHYWVTGGSSGDDDFKFRCEAGWEEHCLEADAEGRAVRLEIRITSWSWLAGKATEPDVTLAGRTLLVEGAGEKRKATLKGPATKAQGAAIWIAIHFGAGEGLPGPGRFLPGEPVVAGATWQADFAGFARAALDYEPATKGVTGEVRLVSLDGKGAARIAWKALVPTQGHTESLIPWTKDGAAHLEGEVVLAPAARLPDGSETWTCALAGEASEGRVNYRIVKRVEVKRTYAPLPAAAAGAEPAAGGK